MFGENNNQRIFIVSIIKWLLLGRAERKWSCWCHTCAISLRTGIKLRQKEKNTWKNQRTRIGDVLVWNYCTRLSIQSQMENRPSVVLIIRVAKCHGYDGYIRIKIFAYLGKKSRRTSDLAKLRLFWEDLHNLWKIFGVVFNICFPKVSFLFVLFSFECQNLQFKPFSWRWKLTWRFCSV